MIQVHTFTFNPFSENTYILSDETKECVIIDPGCHNYEERKELKDFIDNNNLKVVHLLNTHAHIDHVLGNEYVKRTFGVKLHLHRKDLPVLQNAASRAEFYGFPNYEGSEVDVFIEEGDIIKFGNTDLEISSSLDTPLDTLPSSIGKKIFVSVAMYYLNKALAERIFRCVVFQI